MNRGYRDGGLAGDLTGLRGPLMIETGKNGRSSYPRNGPLSSRLVRVAANKLVVEAPTLSATFVCSLQRSWR